MTFKTVITKNTASLCAAALFIATGLTSCEGVYDSRQDCVSGVQLRFIHDYHMEPGANSFPLNVDCVTVYAFDPSGNYVGRFSETSEALRNEGYRMPLPLESGDYHLIVYGGLACEHPTFDITPEFREARAGGLSAENLFVTLPTDENGVSSAKLHDIENRTGGLFYGTYDLTVDSEDFGSDYTEHTVNLMKNTNNIQVILQEIGHPYEVDVNDFEFTIVDDNFVLDSNNNAVSTASTGKQHTYKPYATENRIVGYVEPSGREGTQMDEDESRPVQVGAAEFSTSRLFYQHMDKARLVITSKKETDNAGTGRTVIDIPLIAYLAAIRGFGTSWIKSDQEFLDRQSNWNLIFFLQNDRWVRTVISVNGWTVRINDIDLDL